MNSVQISYPDGSFNGNFMINPFLVMQFRDFLEINWKFFSFRLESETQISQFFSCNYTVFRVRVGSCKYKGVKKCVSEEGSTERHSYSRQVNRSPKL